MSSGRKRIVQAYRRLGAAADVDNPYPTLARRLAGKSARRNGADDGGVDKRNMGGGQKACGQGD